MEQTENEEHVIGLKGINQYIESAAIGSAPPETVQWMSGVSWR